MCDGVLSVIAFNNRQTGQCTLLRPVYTFRLLNSVPKIFSCTVTCKVDYMGVHHNFSSTQHNVLCNVYSQGSSIRISVHGKFLLSEGFCCFLLEHTGFSDIFKAFGLQTGRENYA